jgi:hypothetical protein
VLLTIGGIALLGVGLPTGGFPAGLGWLILAVDSAVALMTLGIMGHVDDYEQARRIVRQAGWCRTTCEARPDRRILRGSGAGGAWLVSCRLPGGAPRMPGRQRRLTDGDCGFGRKP